MSRFHFFAVLVALTLWMTGCGDDHDHDHDHGEKTHTHDGTSEKSEDGHEHNEVPLGKFDIQGIEVQAVQMHGKEEAGKESHLVIKLPYKDDGASVVRAWMGGEDRTLSTVGKGEYAEDHDGYDIHAVAPDPLAADARWWIEIEKPDGTKAVGSVPLLRDLPKAK